MGSGLGLQLQLAAQPGQLGMQPQRAPLAAKHRQQQQQAVPWAIPGSNACPGLLTPAEMPRLPTHECLLQRVTRLKQHQAPPTSSSWQLSMSESAC